MFYYLRANGLQRSFYLVYLRVVAPLLEPLRRTLVRFLMLPRRRKLRLLGPVAVVCMLFLAALRLWWLVVLLPMLLVGVYGGKFLYGRLRPVMRIRYWREHRSDLLSSGQKGHILTVDRLGLPEEGVRSLKAELEESSEVVIADIDQDGFLLSRFGPIAGAANVSGDEFVARKRYALQVVALGNEVGVKKDYRQNVVGFLNELEVLHTLAGRCNAPAILDLDFSNLTITFAYIPGAVIREELAKRGAVLRNRDMDGDPQFAGLSKEEQRFRRVAEARRVLNGYLDRRMVDAIFGELTKVHRAGVLISDVKYGNIIVERDSGRPYLIDFDHADIPRRSRGLRWQGRRDQEIERFNLFFATDRLTRDRMLQRIAEYSEQRTGRRLGSVDFGWGVAMGRTWDVESGEGRWQTVLRPNLPSFLGKRVLELGCENGLFLLQMLRHGAREAVGIEQDEAWLEQAEFVKEGFEWADSATYSLELIKARIEDISTLDLRRFDLVLALGSLHHVLGEGADDLVRQVGALTKYFLVECNTDLHTQAADVRLRASVDYNTQLLARNGFHIERTVSPPGTKRPLLIATRV